MKLKSNLPDPRDQNPLGLLFLAFMVFALIMVLIALMVSIPTAAYTPTYIGY